MLNKRYCIYCGEMLSEYDENLPISDDICAHCYLHEED